MLLKKILAVMDVKDRRGFWKLFFLQLLSSIFEALALALVIPYVAFLQQPQTLMDYPSAKYLFHALNLTVEPLSIAFFITCCFLALLAIRICLQVYVFYQIAGFPYQVMQHQSKRLLSNYLNMDYLDFASTNSSSLIKNCSLTVDQFATAVLTLLQMLSSFVIASCLLTVLLIESFWISMALTVVFGALAVAFFGVFKKSQTASGVEREQAFADMQRRATEAMQSFKDVRIYNRVSYFTKRYEEAVQRLKKASQTCFFYPTLPSVFIDTVAMTLLLTVVLVYVFLGQSLELLIGQLVLFGLVGRRLIPAFNQVITLQVTLQRLEASVDLMREELNRSQAILKVDCSGGGSFDDAIEFTQIGFVYPDGTRALSNLNLTIQKYKSTAFVGPSGAGKTTIMELLTSLITPSEGIIAIDGKVENSNSLRHLVGYVPQLVSFLDDTLARNIAFGEHIIDAERLAAAIKMAQLDELVDSLPLGLETAIGDRGYRLSGGQKQRVGIARVLYFNPEIIIFDEATSSLDQLTEDAVAQNIRDLKGKKTIVAVAHRINTIKGFDRIYVIDKGAVLATGTHEQLLECCPLYRQLNKLPSQATESYLESEYAMN